MKFKVVPKFAFFRNFGTTLFICLHSYSIISSTLVSEGELYPEVAVQEDEAVLGLVNMIDTDKLSKLSKLDEIDGLKTGLEEVKTQIKAFDATLSQPVKIEDPVLIESGPATRNHCIQFAYIHARNSYKILKRLEEDIPGIKSDIEDIKTQLDEMRKPWWKRAWNICQKQISK